MKIVWFGHSCFRLEIGGSVLLIDPFLKGNASFEASGIAWDEATKGVTHVALTHGHSDHIGDAGEVYPGNRENVDRFRQNHSGDSRQQDVDSPEGKPEHCAY